MVVHIILECQQYNSVRQKYFSVTTLKELFDTVNFEDILSFLRDIHLDGFRVFAVVMPIANNLLCSNHWLQYYFDVR